MEKGLMKMRSCDDSKNKFGHLYLLTPSGMAEIATITHQYLQRKIDEYVALREEIKVLMVEIGDDQVNAPRKAYR
jgi:hypothetical protein